MNALGVGRYLRLLGLGFLVWLIPFVVSFFVFPFRSSAPPFFETIMAVVVTLVGVVFTLVGFRGVSAGFVKHGARLGGVFFALSVLIDLPLFSWGPMATSFANYMMDIGLTYLVYPIVAIGVGYAMERR